jgi:hypothetical protein
VLGASLHDEQGTKKQCRGEISPGSKPEITVIPANAGIQKRRKLKMKRFKAGLSLMTLIALIIFGMMLWSPQVQAATATPSPASSGYETIVLYIPGTISATATPVAFKSPWPYRVLSISAYARAITGGNSTYTINVLQGATSLLNTPLAIATTQAATVLDAVLATSPVIPDEATVSVVLTLGGSTPTIADLTLIMAIKRQ